MKKVLCAITAVIGLLVACDNEQKSQLPTLLSAMEEQQKRSSNSVPSSCTDEGMSTCFGTSEYRCANGVYIYVQECATVSIRIQWQ